MPGSEACGRCGSSLTVATATIDVHPPRARPMAKRVRRALPVRRALYGARDAVAAGGTAIGGARVTRELSRSVPPFGILWRMVFPGWSHFQMGQAWRGRLFLGGFLLFLVPGLLLLGTTAGSILLGLAFSVHSSAALDVFMQASGRRMLRERLVDSILVSLSLAMLVYWPAWWLLSRVVDPRNLQLSIEPFRAGDVVWVSHLGTPGIGRVVLYDMPESVASVHEGHVRYVRLEGERIDRILAGPGDDVRWGHHQLLVNGKPSLLRPIGDLSRLPAELHLKVPDHQYCIVPSTTIGLTSTDPLPEWTAASCVPAGNIRGRVYARPYPPGRFHIFR
jgi:hypothetical protein